MFFAQRLPSGFPGVKIDEKGKRLVGPFLIKQNECMRPGKYDRKLRYSLSRLPPPICAHRKIEDEINGFF